MRIFLSLTAGSGNLNNLKRGRYYSLQPGSTLFLFIWSATDKLFSASNPVKTYVVLYEVLIKETTPSFQSNFLVLSLILKIVRNSEAQLKLTWGYRRMRKKRIRNKNCGMKECKFTPNLKFLIARFLSKVAHHFLLNL